MGTLGGASGPLRSGRFSLFTVLVGVRLYALRCGERAMYSYISKNSAEAVRTFSRRGVNQWPIIGLQVPATSVMLIWFAVDFDLPLFMTSSERKNALTVRDAFRNRAASCSLCFPRKLSRTSNYDYARGLHTNVQFMNTLNRYEYSCACFS